METINQIKKPLCYVAGGMRGYPQFNFPAFDQARDLGISLGFDIISPADIDREDPAQFSEEEFNGGNLKRNQKKINRLVKKCAKRDTQAIFKCTHIAMLPNWQKSTGAKAEFFLAKWLGLTVLDALTFKPFTGVVSVSYTIDDVVFN